MNVRVALLAGLALGAMTGAAYAGEGAYVSLGAGWEKPNDFLFSGLGAAGDATPDSGWIASGAVGMKYGNWRFELEGSGSHTKFVGPFTGGIIWTGASANLLYDFPLLPQIDAYIGGGVGGGELNREAYST